MMAMRRISPRRRLPQLLQATAVRGQSSVCELASLDWLRSWRIIRSLQNKSYSVFEWMCGLPIGQNVAQAAKKCVLLLHHGGTEVTQRTTEFLIPRDSFEKGWGGVHCPPPKGRGRKTLVRRAEALLESISNPAARQIVGRHLYADAITHQNSDAVFAHLAGNCC